VRRGYRSAVAALVGWGGSAGLGRLLAAGGVLQLALLPGEGVAVVGDAGLLGAFAFESEPVGATLPKLVGYEGEYRVAQEQQHSTNPSTVQMAESLRTTR
jgi:hypothetical protein